MRERVRELGGTLDIQSNQGGTTVTALLPVANMAVIDA
jgi:signal transduction histidine kinase